MGFFGLFGSWVATRFAENNIFQNLAEELFEQNPDRTVEGSVPIDLGKNACCFNLKKAMIDSWTWWCCCCKMNKECFRNCLQNEEMKKTNGIDEAIEKDLDLINFMRRMRMLTLGMLVEMDDEELETNEIFGYKRHIDEINRVWEIQHSTEDEFDIDGAS